MMKFLARNDRFNEKSLDESPLELDFSESTCEATIERKLRFAMDKTEVFEVLHRNNMTKKEIKDTWYQETYFARIENDASAIVTLMGRGFNIDSFAGQTARGLEILTKRGANRTARNTIKTTKVVLIEQFKQIVEDYLDEETIAERYREASLRCKEDALAVGTADAAFVEKDLQQFRKMFSKTHTQSSSKSCSLRALLNMVNRSAGLD